MPEIDMVVVGAPNDLHCRITLDAAAAGKHVVWRSRSASTWPRPTG